MLGDGRIRQGLNTDAHGSDASRRALTFSASSWMFLPPPSRRFRLKLSRWLRSGLFCRPKNDFLMQGGCPSQAEYRAARCITGRPSRTPKPHPFASRPPLCSRNVARPKNDASPITKVGLPSCGLVSPDTDPISEDSPGLVHTPGLFHYPGNGRSATCWLSALLHN
jgi:hypothetical protein